MRDPADVSAKLRHRAIWLFCFAVFGFASCEKPRALETITLKIDGHAFKVEVARTLQEQQRGLMYRRKMPENAGMLFVYESDRRLSYWMKNTHIPLSIAYISAGGTIVEIHDMEPESLRGIDSTRSVRYALELNRGAFERIGAESGSVIEFPDGFH